MKFHPGRAFVLIAISSVLSAAASVDWQMDPPAAESMETKTAASPSACTDSGCLAASDSKLWAPFVAAHLATALTRAPR